MPDSRPFLLKESIRNAMREKRRALPAANSALASAGAQRLLLAMPEFAAAEIVCCYLAMPGETDTALIIERCRQSRRMLLVPAFCSDTGAYSLAVLADEQQIAFGPGRVPEPAAPIIWAKDVEPCFWVTPGLAFDSECGRLGHGRGHYDRMFSACVKPAFKVGLAFSWQIVERTPMSAHDVRLDAVVTETKIFRRALPPETKIYNQAAAPPVGGMA